MREMRGTLNPRNLEPFCRIQDMLELEDDRWCFACGERNPEGLKLVFNWDGEALRAFFTPQKFHQGYKDIVHGGIISTVLDECMAQVAIKKTEKMAATAGFRVRFREALMVGEETLTEAVVEKETRRLIEASARMKRVSDGRLIAEARGRLMVSNPSK
jgi:acyl-coenzyme A thioesterase PaaI-like protein